MSRMIALVIPLLLAGCPEPTRFTGEPKFPNGVMGCRMSCEREGLQMVGFVFSGEFSTSCICAPPQTSPPSTAGEGAPTAGVIVQVQAAAAASAAQQQMMMQQQQRQQQRRY